MLEIIVINNKNIPYTSSNHGETIAISDKFIEIARKLQNILKENALIF